MSAERLFVSIFWVVGCQENDYTGLDQGLIIPSRTIFSLSENPPKKT